MTTSKPPSARLAVHAIAAAFCTYFAMYAFRKPFAAASYEGTLFGLDTKTAFVLAQLLGYTLSKYVGTLWLSGLRQEHLIRWLVGSVGIAWLCLFVFALAPPPLAALALFFNGLPLGLVWGLVVRFLDGRRSSELLLAGLSASFIVASGAVKDVGRALMDVGVSTAWMPAIVGLCFLPLYMGAVFALSRIPPPTVEDQALRSKRTPMDGAARRAFVRRFLLGLVLLITVYVSLTAYRDFRDNYAAEIFEALGYGDSPGVFTRTELPVAIGVLIIVGSLSAIRDNRRALIAIVLVMASGVAMLAGGTWLLQGEHISGVAWMIVTGLGSYLAYVPGSALFERLVAATRAPGTAVFVMYLADAFGYTGSFVLQVGRDRFFASIDRLAFFQALSIGLGIGGALLLVIAGVFFLRATRPGGSRPNAG